MKPRRVSLSDTLFVCLHCRETKELDETLEEFLDRRRGKKLMRKIELDDEGYSRKWSGTYIAHDANIIRDDGKGHPHINCASCGKVNVFGKQYSGSDDDDIIQVLGRSESDLRYLKELENGSHRADDLGMVGQADQTKAGLA